MAEPHSESVSKQNSGGDESHQQQSNISDSTSTSRPTGAGVDTGAGSTRPKTEAEKEADRLYEEAIEEEYAKREGGA
jgi:hypothetical protein